MHALIPREESHLLDRGRTRRRRRPLQSLATDALVLIFTPVALTLALIGDTGAPQHDGSGYVTAPVRRGDLMVTVHATGTVEPTRLIEVSTELSGTLSAVLVQANDRVRVGQVLAELDPSAALVQVARARASVAAARARLKEAVAGVRQSKADLERKRALSAGRLTTQRDLDAAEYNSSRTLSSAETLEAEAAAAEADLKLAETNLARTRIVSPVDGIVLRRNAEPGQAIAGALQPPVLFRLAEALDQMQIRVDVDEADAMKVSTGHDAEFSVQALRGQKFKAAVERIHIGPEIVQGVVTYKAILTFDNREIGLKPGMTASADITVAAHRNALLVPNAALRFEPRRPVPSAPVALNRALGIRSAVGSTVPDPDDAPGAGPAVPRRSRLHLLADGAVQPVEVETGPTDGTVTIVVSDGLAEGQRVIVEDVEPKP